MKRSWIKRGKKGFKRKVGKPLRRSRLRKKSPQKISTLRRKCDALIQELGRKKFPKSLISGKPTQVMHHFFPKSVSSFLRYDWNNLIPLTNGEHLRLHSSGDPSIEHRIIEIRGINWFNKLAEQKRYFVKQNRQYYETILSKLLATPLK